MRTDVQHAIRNLAKLILGQRADRRLLLPGLVSTLRVAVNDWALAYGDERPETITARLRDDAILRASPIAKRTRTKAAK